MAIDEIIETNGEQQQWDNPTAPEKTSDSRDKEQIERQYREAKRRHDNLEENQDASEEEKEQKN